MPTEYRNLITGEPAQARPHLNNYFELEIVNKGFGYRFGTAQGENLCAYATANTFGNAWFDALTHTTVGGNAYQAWESWSLHAYLSTEPDSPVYDPEDEALTQKWAEQEGGFDPYAGNLDSLLGY